MDSNDLIVRCSSISDILTGEVGLTETQKERHKVLTDRHASISEKPLTENMLKEMNSLMFKKDNLELGKTCKSKIQEMFNEREFGISNFWTNKYVEKGIGIEDESLMLAQKVNGWDFMTKNEERFTNSFITGEPDAVPDDFVVEIKSSWSINTFPMYETENPNKGYEWQVQGYLWLTDKEIGNLSYCLVDTPEILVVDELYRTARKNGYIDLPPKIEAEIRGNHSYAHINPKLRVNNFEIRRDEKMIERIKERVSLCREYYEELKKITNI